jgi:hypothetical protein
LSAKSRPAAFSYPDVPSQADPACFDVFDATFHAQASESSSDAAKAASFESEAYNAFLRSDGFSGEISAMKKDWLLRMRLDIVSVEQKYKSDVDAVKAHEARGGDPKDPVYARTKFTVGETEKDRATMAIDTEEGHVSVFEHPQLTNLRLNRVPRKYQIFISKRLRNSLFRV